MAAEMIRDKLRRLLDIEVQQAYDIDPKNVITTNQHFKCFNLMTHKMETTFRELHRKDLGMYHDCAGKSMVIEAGGIITGQDPKVFDSIDGTKRYKVDTYLGVSDVNEGCKHNSLEMVPLIIPDLIRKAFSVVKKNVITVHERFSFVTVSRNEKTNEIIFFVHYGFIFS
jgi:hypothetical protein